MAPSHTNDSRGKGAEHLTSAKRGLWERQQLELKSKMVRTDRINFAPGTLRLVGGVDISFIKGNDVDACASLVVCELPSLKVVHADCRLIKLTEPYIAGFLAFREAEHLVALVRDLQATRPDLVPQVLMADGNGILHPRGFGIACHLGVLLDIPCLGVAKTFLRVDGRGAVEVRQQADAELPPGGGSFMPIRGESGAIHGAAVRSTNDCIQPVYVSQGHRLSLATAVAIVARCCRYRIPEPVRQADLRSRDFIRKLDQRP